MIPTQQFQSLVMTQFKINGKVQFTSTALLDLPFLCVPKSSWPRIKHINSRNDVSPLNLIKQRTTFSAFSIGESICSFADVKAFIRPFNSKNNNSISPASLHQPIIFRFWTINTNIVIIEWKTPEHARNDFEREDGWTSESKFAQHFRCFSCHVQVWWMTSTSDRLAIRSNSFKPHHQMHEYRLVTQSTKLIIA